MKQYNGWILLHIQKAATASRFGKIRYFKKFPKRNKTAHSRASLSEKLISSGPH